MSAAEKIGTYEMKSVEGYVGLLSKIVTKNLDLTICEVQILYLNDIGRLAGLFLERLIRQSPGTDR